MCEEAEDNTNILKSHVLPNMPNLETITVMDDKMQFPFNATRACSACVQLSSVSLAGKPVKVELFPILLVSTMTEKLQLASDRIVKSVETTIEIIRSNETWESRR